MKKGGYQVLELNCKGDVPVYDDYKNNIPENYVKVIDEVEEGYIEDFLLNLFKYNKTCLLKNLLINGLFVNFYSNVFTNYDVINIYVIDSSQPNGYSNINPNDNDLFIIKINDDYILLITLDGMAFINKLYKGAITQ